MENYQTIFGFGSSSVLLNHMFGTLNFDFFLPNLFLQELLKNLAEKFVNNPQTTRDLGSYSALLNHMFVAINFDQLFLYFSRLEA